MKETPGFTPRVGLENLEQVFERFLEEWNLLDPLNWKDSSTIWTEAVLKAFRHIAKKLPNRPFAVFPDPDSVDPDYFNDQYMSLDQCWTKKNGETPYWMQLALESEWGNEEEVKEDFYKLTDIKCLWKVMVYAESKPSNGPLIDQLAMIVEGHRFRNDAESYLVIAFEKTNSGDRGYRIRGYCINGQGKIEDGS